MPGFHPRAGDRPGGEADDHRDEASTPLTISTTQEWSGRPPADRGAAGQAAAAWYSSSNVAPGSLTEWIAVGPMGILAAKSRSRDASVLAGVV